MNPHGKSHGNPVHHDLEEGHHHKCFWALGGGVSPDGDFSLGPATAFNTWRSWDCNESKPVSSCLSTFSCLFSKVWNFASRMLTRSATGSSVTAWLASCWLTRCCRCCGTDLPIGCFLPCFCATEVPGWVRRISCDCELNFTTNFMTFGSSSKANCQHVTPSCRWHRVGTGASCTAWNVALISSWGLIEIGHPVLSKSTLGTTPMLRSEIRSSFERRARRRSAILEIHDLAAIPLLETMRDLQNPRCQLQHEWPRLLTLCQCPKTVGWPSSLMSFHPLPKNLCR